MNRQLYLECYSGISGDMMVCSTAGSGGRRADIKKSTCKPSVEALR